MNKSPSNLFVLLNTQTSLQTESEHQMIFFLSCFGALFDAEHDTEVKHTLYAGDWIISLSQKLDTDGYLHENNTHKKS